MALSQDQNDQLNKSLMGQFGAPPAMPAPTFAPSSYDVNTMGPNLDSTMNMAGQMPRASTPKPIPEPIERPTHGASVSWDAPAVPVDTATDDEDDDEKRKSNPKVASSHPGFSPDDLDRYLLKEKDQIGKYGADKQSADFDALRARQHSVGNQVGRGLASLGDGIMQGVAQQGNPNFLEHMDQNQARQLATQTEANKDFNSANMAEVKAKEGLDRQSASNPLGASAAQAMIPMLRQIYPGKSEAEYAQMAHNPAVAEALLPEGVKLADAKARLEDSRAQREVANEMRRESMEMHRDQNYKVGLEKDVSGLDKDANFVKAQGTLDKLGTAKDLLEAGNVNNASAKQALQTALTFVATGGQRVNETEMRQLGGAHTVTNRIGQWMQGLDKGTLTPKDYADMKQVIGIYKHGAEQAMEQHINQKATERAQREHIPVEQARRELGHEAAAPAQVSSSPQITPDVEAYAQKHGITPQQAMEIKMKRTGGR